MTDTTQPGNDSVGDHPTTYASSPLDAAAPAQANSPASALIKGRAPKVAMATTAGVAVTAALTWGIVSSSGAASTLSGKAVGLPAGSVLSTPGTLPPSAEPGQRRQLNRYSDAGYPTSWATRAQQRGVVDIYTVSSDGSQAAGTGIVLTHRGEVVTNNHVVEGSTSIRVVVVSSQATYSARVVGTDATDDVAVLQIRHAPRLATAVLGTTELVRVGDQVTGVGNAGGAGGVPSAASGRVRALDRSITVHSDTGSGVEHLTGLIKVAADIRAGDSGGPLYNADNQVVGLDTAASSGRIPVVGFAVPINAVLAVVDTIDRGVDTAAIRLGYPAFLGVELGADARGWAGRQGGGATVEAVLPGSAAARAGLAAGDTITAIGQARVSSPRELSRLIGSRAAGDAVTVTWSSPSQGAHTATVTLGRGPVD
jgi:S1-C subfamily serine protease